METDIGVQVYTHAYGDGAVQDWLLLGCGSKPSSGLGYRLRPFTGPHIDGFEDEDKLLVVHIYIYR